MKNILLLGLLLVFVVGCAQNKKFMAVKDGMTETQFKRDNYECAQGSRTSWSGGGSGLIGLGMMAGAQDKAQQQANKFYKMCMEAKGYSIIETDETTGSTGFAPSPDLTVIKVVPDSPAERAGIKVGDKVKSANGIQVRSMNEMVTKIPAPKIGEKRTYIFEREGKEFAVDMVAEPLSKFAGK